MILYLTPKSKICLVLEGILFTKHNVARVKWLLGILDISEFVLAESRVKNEKVIIKTRFIAKTFQFYKLFHHERLFITV